METENSNQSNNRSFQEKKLNLVNFLIVQKACELALVNSEFFAIIGEPGSGKSTALEHFRDSKSNQVKLFSLQATMNMADFFHELAKLFGYRGVKKSKFLMSSYIKEYCNSIDQKEVLIIDEAGRFKPKQFIYLQEVRDITKDKLGIVLGGPQDFLKNLISWDNTGIMGVAECKRRIQMFIKMKKLGRKENIAVCREYGIDKTEMIREGFIQYDNIDELTKAIKEYLKYKKEFDQL